MIGTLALRRRQLLLNTGGLAVAGLMPGLARAQDRYPARPVRIVSQFAAGGPADIIARIVAERLQSRWGQPVVVENRIGAAGTIGATHVARSAPDGYTLLMATNTHVMNPTLIPNLQYDPIADFTPIMRVASYYMFLVCHPSVPAQNVQELIALAKRDPGGSPPRRSASARYRTWPPRCSRCARRRADLRPLFRFGPERARGAEWRGEDPLSGLPGHGACARGKLRVLGAGSPGSSPDAPGVPTIAEQGLPGFEAPVWFGMLGPRGMPRP